MPQNNEQYGHGQQGQSSGSRIGGNVDDQAHVSDNYCLDEYLNSFEYNVGSSESATNFTGQRTNDAQNAVDNYDAAFKDQKYGVARYRL